MDAASGKMGCTAVWVRVVLCVDETSSYQQVEPHSYQ